ncbi:MAG TPA: rod shape-determining protein MreD [Acidimicrobiales bacterium]|nr:rod shape-determining protein MreD [Acidimicrobiales bacterium]
MKTRPPGPVTFPDVVRFSVVLAVSLTAQHALLDSVRASGAHPEAMLLLPAAAGYVAGPERGAVAGFFTGLVADLLLPTTFGLTALVGCLIGFVVGVATSGLVRTSWSIAVLSGTAATVIGLCAYAILGAVLGQPSMLTSDLAPALVVATPSAVVLAVPALALVRWAIPPPAPAASVPSAGPGW